MTKQQALTSENFTQHVDGLPSGLDVLDAYVRSAATPKSSLIVCGIGGYVIDCSLTSPTTGIRRPVLYTSPNQNNSNSELVASHLMMPVGPYADAGGQHVPLHRRRYTTETAVSHVDRVGFRLKPPVRDEEGLEVTQRFDLTADTLKRTLHFANRGHSSGVSTSLGFHDYLHLPKGGGRLRINNQPLDDLLEERGAEAAIMSGEARLWRGFGRRAIVSMPGGSQLRLQAEAYTGSDYPGDLPLASQRVDMLLWSRPDAEGGNPFICLEPVVGVESFDPLENQKLIVPPGSDGTFQYSIQAA